MCGCCESELKNVISRDRYQCLSIPSTAAVLGVWVDWVSSCRPLGYQVWAPVKMVDIPVVSSKLPDMC